MTESGARTARRFLDRRREQVVGPPLTEDQRARLIEVVGGVPICRRTAPAPRRPEPGRLQVGQLVHHDDGSVWRVEKVGPGAADLRCVLSGRDGKTGDTTAASPSSAGYRLTSESEVELRRAAEAESRASARARAADEHRCPNCWPGEPERDLCDNVVRPGDPDYKECWAARGRDPKCPDHQVDPEELARAQRGAVRARRVETPEDVAKVLALREQGLTYDKIEAEMGWPVRGGRAYRIVKQSEGAQ